MCVLPLVLTSCGGAEPKSQDAQPASAPVRGSAEPTSASASTSTSTPEPTDATDEPTSGTARSSPTPDAAQESPAADESGGDGDADADYEVSDDRVQGITLVVYRASSGGSSRQVAGRLVTGPGGCLSLSQQDRPRLLTFPEGTRLTPGRPSVRLPGGKRVYVGDRFQVSIGDLSLSDLSGLPRRCQQGADDVVHEVAG